MNETKGLFDKKHATLWRISMWANGLAPLSILLFILLALSDLLRFYGYAQSQYTDLTELLARDFVTVLSLLAQMARWIITGIFYFLVLKSIALALDMIVETDFNYREKDKNREIIE